MKLIFTGFDPFGGESINPSYEAVKRLPDAIKGAEIIKLEMPTVYERAGILLADVIRREQPDAVICVGQAGGRDAVTPERIAINMRDARIPDNAGRSFVEESIRADGPAAFFSTLPNRAIVRALMENGLQARISNSAGTFVCNDIMYMTLRHAALECPSMKAGFIHVPFLPEQVRDKPGIFSMELNDMVRALTIAAEVVIDSLE